MRFAQRVLGQLSTRESRHQQLEAPSGGRSTDTVPYRPPRPATNLTPNAGYARTRGRMFVRCSATAAGGDIPRCHKDWRSEIDNEPKSGVDAGNFGGRGSSPSSMQPLDGYEAQLVASGERSMSKAAFV